MKKPSFLFVVFLLCATAANAQVSGNAYIGYSYFRTPEVNSGLGTTPINPAFSATIHSANLNGWNGSVEFKLHRWIGGVADFGGNYGTQTTGPICPPVGLGPCSPPINFSVSDHTFLFGPRASVSLGKFKPFVHGLLGGTRTKTTILGGSFTNTVFSTAIGGGLDTRIAKGFAWRVQADDVRINFSGGAQHNLRLTTGLVLRF